MNWSLKLTAGGLESKQIWNKFFDAFSMIFTDFPSFFKSFKYNFLHIRFHVFQTDGPAYI